MDDEFQLDGDVERASRDTYWTQQQINGNAYIVHFGPPAEDKAWNDKIFVEVWAARDGSECEVPDHPSELGSMYREDPHKMLVSEEIYMRDFKKGDDEFSTFLSQGINEAVCELEDKLDHRESFEDDVLAAIEANKEVHEGIDYELEAEDGV